MNNVTEFPVAPEESVTLRPVRPLYWSVRREIWENRALYIAPAIVAAFVIVGFCFSMIGLPARRRAVLQLDPQKQLEAIGMPYDVAAAMLILTSWIVGAIYLLDALYGERRDRSILFLKSLQVSDRETVLSKLLIAAAVLPALVFVITVVMQVVMMTLMSVVLTVNGLDPITTWRVYNLFEQSLIEIYGLAVTALWHAPVYAWFLFLSSRLKHAVVLWALVPPLAIAGFERIAFGSTWVLQFLGWRLFTGLGLAFDFQSKGLSGHIHELTPGRFLTTPGLWIGLAIATVLVAATIRNRRLREPI